MNTLFLKEKFTSEGAGSPTSVPNPALLIQSEGGPFILQGSNAPHLPGSWSDIATSNDFVPVNVTTSFAWVRAIASGAGVVYVSSAAAPSAGSGGGGGGGGAVTIADGADVTQGARAQTAATDDTGTWSLIQLTKRGLQRISTILDRLPALVSGRMPVDGSGVTQPVSASTLPLPTGAATGTKQDTTNARLSRMGGLAVAEVDEVAGTTYVLYRSSIDSAMSYVVVRSVTTGGATAVRYAGVANNPTMTTSSAAWTARVTLTYGSLAEA